MYRASGILQYSVDWTGHKLICLIDQNIVDYYYKLIPKYLDARPQMYKAHISIVRWEYVKSEFWGKYEGQAVDFEYNGKIRHNEKYFWVDANSDEFEKIRVELGLSAKRKEFDCFHITIANRKEHVKTF